MIFEPKKPKINRIAELMNQMKVNEGKTTSKRQGKIKKHALFLFSTGIGENTFTKFIMFIKGSLPHPIPIPPAHPLFQADIPPRGPTRNGFWQHLTCLCLK